MNCDSELEKMIADSGADSYRYSSGLKLEIIRQSRRQRRSLVAKKQFLQVVIGCLFCSVVSLQYWGNTAEYRRFSLLPINPEKLMVLAELTVAPEMLGTFEHALAIQQQRHRLLLSLKAI